MEENISKHDLIDPNEVVKKEDRGKRRKIKKTKNPDFKKKVGLPSVKFPQCQICGLVCSSRSNLKKHVLVHTGDKPYECKYCGKRFRQIQHVNDHQRTHTGEKPFECLTCGKCFTQKSAVNVHMKRHSGNKEFNCIICDKDFYDKNQLKIHLRCHTGEQPYQCVVCKKSFSTVTRLKIHKMIHTGDRPFSCEKCGASFREKSGLNVHMGTHLPRGPFICSECGQEFKRMQSLSLHKKVHEANTSYVYIGPKQTMNTDKMNKLNGYINIPVYGVISQAKENDYSDKLVMNLGSDSIRENSNIDYMTQPKTTSTYTSIDHNEKYRENTETISTRSSLQTDMYNQKILPNSQTQNKQNLPSNIPTPQVVQEAMANGTLLETKGENGQPKLIVLPKSMSEKDISFISTNKSEAVPFLITKVLNTSLHKTNNNVHDESKENDLSNTYGINNIHSVCNDIHDMKNMNSLNEIDNMSNMESVNDVDNINNEIYNETNLTSEMLANESITLELPFVEENSESEECNITISDTRLAMTEVAGPELVTDGEINYIRSVDMEFIENNYDLTQNEFLVTSKKRLKKEKKSRIPKSYYCEQCGKNCKTSSNYITHMRSHTGERPYICAFCNTGFKQPSHLRSHILRHTGERPYLCHLCTCAFTQSSRLKAHIKSIHESGKFNLRQKNKIVRKKKIRNFYCKFCKKTLINECFKSDHMELHKPLRFMCNTCNITFKSHSSFQKHVIIHNNGPNCHLCNIPFYSDSQRQSHIADHMQPVEIPKHENVNISTHRGALNYVNEENSANNSAYVMTQDTVQQQNIVNIENHSDKLPKTNLSKKNFHNENKKEILKNSPNNNSGKINVKIGENNFIVLNSNIQNQNNQCDIALNQENKNVVESEVEVLKSTSPNKIVENNFSIENSKEIMKNSTKRGKLHNFKQLDETTGNTVYKCNYCDKIFNQSANLSVHLRIHTGDRPFVCNICSANFRQIQHLKSHMVKHTGKKPFVCQLCKKAFTQKSAMKRHQLLHKECSIEINNHCTKSDEFDSHNITSKICNKEVLPSQIETHMQEHHDIDNELSSMSYENYEKKSQLKTNKNSSVKNELHQRKFECMNCGEIFHEMSNFKTHLIIHNGGQEVIICEKCGIVFKRKSALKSHLFIHHLVDEVVDNKGECLDTFSESKSYKLILKGEEDLNIEVFDTNETIYEETFDTYKTICNNERGIDKSYICNFCDKQYQRKNWLMRHIQNVHNKHNFHKEYAKESERIKCTPIDNVNNEKICNRINDSFQFDDSVYVCHLCGKSFTRAAKLKDHVEKWCKNNSSEENELNLKKFKIQENLSNIDDNKLSDRNYRKEHDDKEVGNSNKTIIEDKLFCNLCDAVFDTKTSFSIHYDINHKTQENLIKENILTDSPKQTESHTSDYWSCIECNLSFKSFVAFSKHEESHKRNEEQSSSSSENSTVSKGPGNKVCISKPQVKLKYGKQKIKQLYRCTFCNKGFRQKYMLDEHKIRVHFSDKKVEKLRDDSKDIEPQILRNERKISLDNETVESKEKCSQLLGNVHFIEEKDHSKKSKIKNINECHNDGDKMFKCAVCNIELSYAEELINHSSVHTGNLPYRCDKCPFAFSQKSHLISHYRKHKGSISDKNLKDINRYDNNIINSEAKDLLNKSKSKTD